MQFILEHLEHDAAVWVAISFFIFMGLAVWKVLPMMNKSLDNYSVKIADELSRAEELKRQAQTLLATTQKKASEAERTAQEIIERAKFEAKLIADEAEKDIEREIERKIKLAEQKIARAEEAAIENVRAQAVETAINTASEILKKELGTGKNSEKQLEKSLRLIAGNIR